MSKARLRSKVRSNRKLTDSELFELLNDAVSAEYWDDICKAGLVTSKIQHEPPMYYVAVARYHDHHTNKQIVVSAKDASFSKALRDCANAWLGKVLPPPKEDLKQKLLKGL